MLECWGPSLPQTCCFTVFNLQILSHGLKSWLHCCIEAARREKKMGEGISFPFNVTMEVSLTSMFHCSHAYSPPYFKTSFGGYAIHCFLLWKSNFVDHGSEGPIWRFGLKIAQELWRKLGTQTLSYCADQDVRRIGENIKIAPLTFIECQFQRWPYTKPRVHNYTWTLLLRSSQPGLTGFWFHPANKSGGTMCIISPPLHFSSKIY